MKNNKWHTWLLYLCGILYIAGVFLRRFSGKIGGPLNTVSNIVIIVVFLFYVILNIILSEKVSKKQFIENFKNWSTSKKLVFVCWIVSDIYLLGTGHVLSHLTYIVDFLFLNIVLWRILFGIGKKDKNKK